MSFTATFVMIFLIVFVLLGGVVMYLSKTIDHGEARFDSKTGQVKCDDGPEPPIDPVPAKRIEKLDEIEK